MSAAAPPGAAAAGPGSDTGNLSEGCPLCGSPLRHEQEWCLNCGAAARTRLAAAPNWRAPLVTLAVLVALALGVLAGSLVKLAGNSGPAPAPLTTTVTGPAAATLPTPGVSTPLGGATTATIPPATTVTTAPAGPTTTAPTSGTSQTTTTTRAGGALSGLGGGTQAGR